MIEDVAEAFRAGRRFLVTSHVSPDGDAVGSMLGVARLLEDNGKQAVAFHSEPVPPPYTFLAGADRVASDPRRVRGAFDTVVVVDVSERERIPEVLPRGTKGARVVVVDHHKTHGPLGDVVFRNPSAAAVGQMVAQLARHLGWKVTPEFAECAYAALLSDTGSFRYSSATAEAFECAAFLVSAGVQPWKVASHVYESWPAERLQLLGAVLRTLRLGCEGRMSSMVVTDKMLETSGASVDMTEGFVNYGRMAAGVEVSAIFRENGGGFRVSFRSRGKVDVSAVAESLGGGGHANAAGATVAGRLPAVRRKVESLVRRALESTDAGEGEAWTRR